MFSASVEEQWQRVLESGNRILPLSHEDIDDSVASDLADALKENETLHELHLEFNSLTGEGARVLAESFIQNANSRLRVLNLMGNSVGDIGAIAISKLVSQSSFLISLELADNEIGADGCVELAHALEKNPEASLTYLDLQDNAILGSGAVALGRAIAVNKNLDQVILKRCSISGDGIVALADGLRPNKTLTILDVSENETAFTDIRDSLERNRKMIRENFLRALTTETKGPWNRSKLMFIGQGRAGKTSLVRALLGKPFSEKQDSTVGASVSQTQTATTKFSKWSEITDPSRNHSSATNFRQQVAARAALNKIEGTPNTDTTPNLKANATEANTNRPSKSTRLSRVSRIFLKEKTKRSSKQTEGTININNLPREDETERDSNEGIKNSETENDNHMKTESLIPLSEESDPDKAAKFSEYMYSSAKEQKDTIAFSLWDYGGQEVFYAMHHLFLTKLGLYVLVFDMREVIKNEREAINYLEFWLNSISLHAREAPCILVGTFLDQLQADSSSQRAKLERIDSIIKKHLLDSGKYEQVVKNEREGLNFFAVSNFLGNGIEYIRNVIEAETLKMSFVSRQVSLKWMACLDEIFSMKDGFGEPLSWITLNTVQTISRRLGIRSSVEVDEMLSMFHDLGVIVHMSGSELLRETITLQPQWLIDGICRIIRDEDLHPVDEVTISSAGLSKDLKRLYTQGLASNDLFDFLLSENGTFERHIGFFRDLMRHMILLSDWKLNGENIYLIPSLLKDNVGAKIISKDLEDLGGGFTASSNECIFEFSEALPLGVFQRIVCLCVSFSTTLNTEDSVSGNNVDDHVLYRSEARISLGEKVKLYILESENKVYVDCVYVDNKENESKSSANAATCFNIVSSSLKKLNQDIMGSGLEWEVFFKTKDSFNSNGSLQEFYSLEEARNIKLAPWFAKREIATVSIDNFLTSF